MTCFFSNPTYGQYGQVELFPGVSGDALLRELVENYQAQIIFFDYGTSRDTMFRNVYGVNDSLRCVYSGHTVYMDPSKDPTTTVYMNGSDNGINTEHTFPQSKGAEFGNARSDMHHLYPTRAKVNEERSNFPFGDIDDNETDVWFYKDKSQFNKPTTNIDEYSEWKWQMFEPRESHKGNVARAIMYFYTMYKAQADAADPDYFSSMLPTLCEWHFLDPVDSLEWVRTWKIAKWQVYPNPFVLDCSLVSRTYCNNTNEACQLAVNVKETALKMEELDAFYALDLESFVINLDLESNANVTFLVYDMTGRLIQSKQFNNLSAGKNSINLKSRSDNTGIMLLKAKISFKNQMKERIKKVTIMNR